MVFGESLSAVQFHYFPTLLENKLHFKAEIM